MLHEKSRHRKKDATCFSSYVSHSLKFCFVCLTLVHAEAMKLEMDHCGGCTLERGSGIEIQVGSGVMGIEISWGRIKVK